MLLKILLGVMMFVSLSSPCLAMTIVIDKQFSYIPEQNDSTFIDDNKNVYIKVDVDSSNWVISINDIVNPLK